MPINPLAVQGRDARFGDQRWLLDLVIELAGPGLGPGPARVLRASSSRAVVVQDSYAAAVLSRPVQP